MGGYVSSIFEQQARRAQTGSVPGLSPSMMPQQQYMNPNDEDELNPTQQVDLTGMYQPGLPSSPRVHATTPEPNPSGAPKTDAGMTPTTTPQAPAPAPNSSSFLDRILHEQDDLNAMVKNGPQVRPLTKAEKIAGIIAAGTTGWIEGGRYNGNPAAGFQAAQSIYSRPRIDAEQEWQRKMAAQESQINSDVRLKNIQDQEADRKALEGERQENANYHKWEREGGPETARIQAQQKDRDAKADELAKAGFDAHDVAEFRATGSLRRLDPQNEAELAMAAAGGDTKAGAALKLLRDTKIEEMRNARDPNEQLRLYHEWRTGDIMLRGQLATELEKMQADPMSKGNDGAQQRMAAIQRQIDGLDKDIEFTTEQVAGKTHGGSNRPAPPPSNPQGPGKWDPRRGRYVTGPQSTTP